MGIPEVDDEHLRLLANALPPNLVHLVLSFDSCKSITDGGLAALSRGIPPGVTSLHWIS